MFELYKAAGWVSWFLITPCSVFALAIILERLYSLRRSVIASPDLLGLVIQEYQSRGLNNERVNQLEAHSPLGRVLATALRNLKTPRDIAKEAVEETGRAVAHELERFLSALGTIATVAPLLGLLGTVIGMIHLFGAQSMADHDPKVLANGIAEALNNTAFGLIVAIPAMIFYRHFRARVEALLVDMEQQAIKLMEVIHGERRQ